MGTNFSKLQGVLSFVLQVLPADNLKGFKTQSTTKSRHQKYKEQTECVHLPLPLLNAKNLLTQNKIYHIQLNQLHYLSKMQRQEVL
jgi:hypothetical protein